MCLHVFFTVINITARCHKPWEVPVIVRQILCKSPQPYNPSKSPSTFSSPPFFPLFIFSYLISFCSPRPCLCLAWRPFVFAPSTLQFNRLLNQSVFSPPSLLFFSLHPHLLVFTPFISPAVCVSVRVSRPLLLFPPVNVSGAGLSKPLRAAAVSSDYTPCLGLLRTCSSPFRLLPGWFSPFLVKAAVVAAKPQTSSVSCVCWNSYTRVFRPHVLACPASLRLRSEICQAVLFSSYWPQKLSSTTVFNIDNNKRACILEWFLKDCVTED